MSFDVTRTLGVHSGGTKFYEIVMIYNDTSDRGTVFQRNGGIAVKDRPGKGQVRLMGAGSLYVIGELFRRKVKSKSEYSFDDPLTITVDADSTAEILDAYSLDPTIAEVIRSDLDLGSKEQLTMSSLKEQLTMSSLIEEEAPVPKVIPSHYGGW